MCPGPHQNEGQGWRNETGLSIPVKYFTDVPRRYFFGVSFMFFCLVFVMLLNGSVYLCLVITFWERVDPL